MNILDNAILLVVYGVSGFWLLCMAIAFLYDRFILSPEDYRGLFGWVFILIAISSSAASYFAFNQAWAAIVRIFV